MKKISKSNRKERKPSITGELQERDIFFFKKVPVSDDYLRSLARELVFWALNDDKALKVTQFRFKRHISRDVWDLWTARCPELRDANEFALEVIGDRREMGGLEKRFDSSIVSYTMPHYDPVWKELVAWKAALQDKERDQQAQNFVIQMPSFGDMNAISNDDSKVKQVQAETVSDRSLTGPGE